MAVLITPRTLIVTSALDEAGSDVLSDHLFRTTRLLFILNPLVSDGDFDWRRIVAAREAHGGNGRGHVKYGRTSWRYVAEVVLLAAAHPFNRIAPIKMCTMPW